MAAIKSIFVDDVTPVPASAVFIAGTAFAADGSMYVCPYPSDVVGIRYRGPFANRKDGARIINAAGVSVTRRQGISFTALDEMMATATGPEDVVLSGVPLKTGGQVFMTAVS